MKFEVEYGVALEPPKPPAYDIKPIVVARFDSEWRANYYAQNFGGTVVARSIMVTGDWDWDTNLRCIEDAVRETNDAEANRQQAILELNYEVDENIARLLSETNGGTAVTMRLSELVSALAAAEMPCDPIIAIEHPNGKPLGIKQVDVGVLLGGDGMLDRCIILIPAERD